MKSLKTHFKPQVIIIYERYQFYTHSQKFGGSTADFAAGFKSCARSCEFCNVEGGMLRDRFVIGISDVAT